MRVSETRPRPRLRRSRPVLVTLPPGSSRIVCTVVAFASTAESVRTPLQSLPTERAIVSTFAASPSDCCFFSLAVCCWARQLGCVRARPAGWPIVLALGSRWWHAMDYVPAARPQGRRRSRCSGTSAHARITNERCSVQVR